MNKFVIGNSEKYAKILTRTYRTVKERDFLYQTNSQIGF